MGEDAKVNEIKDAFIKLSKEHHPDVSGNASSSRKWIKVKNAYDSLKEMTKDSSNSQTFDAYNETHKRSESYEQWLRKNKKTKVGRTVPFILSTHYFPRM